MQNLNFGKRNGLESNRTLLTVTTVQRWQQLLAQNGGNLAGAVADVNSHIRLKRRRPRLWQIA
jgi:hypothetical protein